ncbi:MAG: twin-arginine translocation signal domain-containing protein [Gemmatimonadaceae bacterium]|nr:TldD/PmbA family protein [Gemmatimonas sp.]MBX9855384.1 twin-arginine translocation signal domain-containing protein [Gemmatimonadaceae bacterium]
MSNSRRDFLKTGAAVAAGTLVASSPLLAESRLIVPGPLSDLPRPDDPAIKALMEVALNTAKSGGASYADVRVAARRQQNVNTRDRIVQGVSDTDTYGLGVRTLVDGAWGFAATSKLDRDSVANATRAALEQARANRASQLRPVVLAPTPGNQVGEWKSPIKVDPFTIAITDKVAFLLAANEAALKVKGVRNVTSSMFFLREEKSLMTTDGSYIVQTIYRTSPNMSVTAVSADFSDFQTVQSNEVAPMGLGYEHVTGSRLAERAPEWGELAVQKLTAKPVDPGRYDLLLHPSNLWLTIHEVIGHPTELDRALGYEANYAGTSFLSPPASVLGKLKYGTELMNVVGDREQPGSLGAIGWDDEGVKPTKFDIVKNGIFVDYQTTREQAPMLADYYKSVGKEVRSYGCSYAQSWADVQFQRMPNVSLLPGNNDDTWESMIAKMDRGIAIVGDGSFSIDQQRYNGQFAGQVFYEVRGGKIVGQLKDVAYQFRTPEFWNSLKAIGGPRSYHLGGAFGDGKGQPAQSNSVSHGCVPSLFQQVNVINTGRTA